jgi:hypothetical protein
VISNKNRKGPNLVGSRYNLWLRKALGDVEGGVEEKLACIEGKRNKGPHKGEGSL